MHSIKVGGQEIEPVYDAAAEAIDHARRGDGPVLLVVDTYRLVGHYVGDPQVYRPKGELQELRETQDPITSSASGSASPTRSSSSSTPR